jgi:hypothetical protein
LEKFIGSDREFTKARGRKGTSENIPGKPITRTSETADLPVQRPPSNGFGV